MTLGGLFFFFGAQHIYTVLNLLRTGKYVFDLNGHYERVRIGRLSIIGD